MKYIWMLGVTGLLTFASCKSNDTARSDRDRQEEMEDRAEEAGEETEDRAEEVGEEVEDVFN